jgi:hypothetical protein
MAVLSALERKGVRYAIFGAIALNVHGLARFTEDLDLFIAPDTTNVDRLRSALQSVFGDPEIDAITADDLLGPFPAIQYIPPDGTFHIDLLTRVGLTFTFDNLEVHRVRLGNLEVSVVSPQTLYRMKKDSVRLKDRADAEVLRERFNLEES